MKHYMRVILAAVIITIVMVGCKKEERPIKIGVSFGVGNAVRWDLEKQYMEQRAGELGADIEVRLNREDKPKTQQEDCFEMIDSGIDVLIYTPRDSNNVKTVLDYAKEKNVPVVSYARVVLGEKVDFFVGYDCERMGQMIGQYLSEMVYKGDYILLQGDPNDNNAILLHKGAMRYISPIQDSIRVILDASVPSWSQEEAKKMVLEAVAANGNKVDAILAPNDKIAGACVEALQELGVTEKVVITGMDAELDAVKRIADGTQGSTIYMDLRELAYTAAEQAYKLGKGEEPDANAEFENGSGTPIKSNLITGQLVTKQNMDKILIDSEYFTKEQIYGK